MRLTSVLKQIVIGTLVLLFYFGAAFLWQMEAIASNQAKSVDSEKTNSTAMKQNETAAPQASNQGTEKPYRESYEKATVLEVQKGESQNSDNLGSGIVEQSIKVRVLTGPYTGKELNVINNLSGTAGIDINVEPGDQVILCFSLRMEAGGKESIESVYLSDRVRSPALGWLLFLFCGLILIIGRLQGLKALLGLGATALGIYTILLPGLMAGKNALPLTIMVLIGVTMITMVFVGGLTRKALAATLGTLGGLIAAGLLAYFFGDIAHLGGLSTEEERMLLYIDNVKIDMRGLLFSGILIGAVGAIMDVAMSVASTIGEVKKADPKMKTIQLIGAGMNVGRDIMGTMANTLILAYTGSALPLMLLFIAYKMEPIRILNWEMIATEIVRALVGSIALIICIPITALIAGWLNNSLKPAAASSKDKIPIHWE